MYRDLTGRLCSSVVVWTVKQHVAGVRTGKTSLDTTGIGLAVIATLASHKHLLGQFRYPW